MKIDLSFNIGLKKTNQVSFNIGSDKKISLCCTMINIPDEEKLKILNDSIFVSKQYKEFKLSYDLINFRKNEENSYIYEDIFINKYTKGFYNSNPSIRITLPMQKELKIYDQEDTAVIQYKNGIISNKSLFADVLDLREINLYKQEFVFKKLIETDDLRKDQKGISREKITFQIIDTIKRLKKSIKYHSLDIVNMLCMSVNSKNINDKFTDIFLNIKNRNLFYFDSYFLNVKNRQIYYLDNSFVSIGNREVYYFKHDYNLDKRNGELNRFSSDYFIYKDIHYLKREYKDYFASKVRSYLKSQYEDYFASTKESYLKRQYDDYFLNKNIIDVFRQYKDFYINKGEKFTNREYRITSAYKFSESITTDNSMINATLNEKYTHINNSDYFASNESKEMYINDDKNCNSIIKPGNISTYDIFSVDLDNRGVMLYAEDLLNLDTDDYRFYVLNSNFVFKDNIKTKLEDTLCFAALKPKGTFKDDGIIELDLEKSLIINEYGLFLDKGFNEIKQDDYNFNYFASKKEHKSEMSKNLKQPKIDYIVKEVHVNKFKNKKSFKDNYEFVSVINSYEDWNENVNNGQIDELLLPHKDYDYTSFLRELINDDGSIKSEYITGYDKNSMRYSVKLPIENPIEVYNYIGREYIDLDVGFLKYFITLLESRWKSNIYNYAAMYAVDVLTDMMEFLYDFFEKKYAQNTKHLKMAERSMQLFRWYCEMAILNNCNYELEFATKKISVDYANKYLNDFNNMTILNNMEITNNYVLEPIDKLLPCSIIFVNINKEKIPKLDLYFKLYNCNSDSSILITDNNNNVTETLYKPGVYELNLELENKITIQYEPTDINQSIAISGANISNYPTRNFTVRYNGKIGDVNPILKDLFNKLLLFTDAEKKTASNVAPATVAIYKMIEYFDLHHTDKVKGKRLTIKK